MEPGESKEETVRRVRALLRLASKKGTGGGEESPKEKARRETEFFKKLFISCDSDGGGTLYPRDILKMARKHLKIAKRLVSDEQIMQFFAAMDKDGGGDIDFTEFLAFVRKQEDKSRLNAVVMKQVRRAVRLAIARQGMTAAQVERRFYNSAAEGIVDSTMTDVNLGPEEMRRFFRKVLNVSCHEAPDKNLMIAFKEMDEDGGGTLDASEFMEFIRASITEETTLCPQRPEGAPVYAPHLLGGMRGALPERAPTSRPGSTPDGNRSSPPFCYHGRELAMTMRLSVSTPNMLKPDPRALRAAQASLGFLPTSHARPRTGSVAQRSPSAGSFFVTTGAAIAGQPPHAAAGSPRGPDGASRPATPPVAGSLPQLSPDRSSKAPAGEDSESRGSYIAVKGILCAKDAASLNRIEERLFKAGVDVRGRFHKYR